MLVGHVIADDQHTSHPARLGFIVDRAVAVGPPDVLTPAMAGDRNKLVLVPSRPLAGHDEFDLRADNVPDFLPTLPPALAEGTGVAFRTHRLAVGVVVELDEFRTPENEHRMPGVQDQPDGCAKALRPGLRRAN
ncbi:hypothetical protein BAL199_02919 [alpha proteobacterium BAL199]|nr:hypothetical protein BAL199_02919 [alpha proteobacterium BAL199]